MSPGPPLVGGHVVKGSSVWAGKAPVSPYRIWCSPEDKFTDETDPAGNLSSGEHERRLHGRRESLVQGVLTPMILTPPTVVVDLAQQLRKRSFDRITFAVL